MKIKISAIITSFNEEKYIEDCIRSVLWCDEIILVDSYSTDLKLEFARQFDKVNIYQHEYFGAAAQKNWALQKANHQWIFILDADERCPVSLREEIQGIIRETPKYKAYSMSRANYFKKRRIRFSGWRRDRVIRFFKQGAAKCPYLRVHGGVKSYDKPFQLHGKIHHLMVDDWPEYFEKLDIYSYWAASDKWVKQKSAHFMKPLSHGIWRFTRDYLFALGFLDGLMGLKLCYYHGASSFKKYSLLRKWQRENKIQGKEPLLPKFETDPTIWEGVEGLRYG